MSEHQPIKELVMPMDCYYGECDHGDSEDHEMTLLVCDTCRDVIELEEIEAFVAWPCEHESRRMLEQTLVAAEIDTPERQSNG